MKKQIPSFAAGMLTMALIGSISVGALAATGQLTINVDPVNIKVKGETFQPKDPNGKEVPVFAYQGTTYAPLRALAEAYGLEVGYDKTANMATVAERGSTTTPSTPPTTDYSKWSAEEEKAYQEFKGMWKITQGEKELATWPSGKEMSIGYTALYQGDKSLADLSKTIINNDTYRRFYERLCHELILPDFTQIAIYFGHADGYNDSLGRALLNSKGFCIIGWSN